MDNVLHMAIMLGINTPAKHAHPMQLATEKKQPEPITWGGQANKPKTEKWWCTAAEDREQQFKLINTVILTFALNCITNQHDKMIP